MNLQKRSYTQIFAYALLVFFSVNVLLVVATVIVGSFSQTWFGTLLPTEWTLKHFVTAFKDHNLGDVVWFTLKSTLLTTALAMVMGFPVAYGLTKLKPAQKAIGLLFFSLPMFFPPMTYGLALASLFYKWNLTDTLAGVTLINLVPALPYSVIILLPFLEQVDPRLESAAKLMGANTRQFWFRVLLPIVQPGLFAATLLTAIKTIASFELTYLIAGAKSKTLIVAVYNDAYGAGSRAGGQIDAMAVIYLATTLLLLAASMFFISPEQIVHQRRSAQPKSIKA